VRITNEPEDSARSKIAPPRLNPERRHWLASLECPLIANTGHSTYTHVAKRTKQAYAVRRLKGRGHGPVLSDSNRSPNCGAGHYTIVRRIWERDENGAEAVSRREPSVVTQAEEKPNGA
jgi:hypothetical protein